MDEVLRIGTYVDGSVSLNGRDASLDDVRLALAELTRRRGVVWYYRESAGDKPHPNAMRVIEAVVDAQVPITMSTKPDYSDVVLGDGTTKPR